MSSFFFGVDIHNRVRNGAKHRKDYSARGLEHTESNTRPKQWEIIRSHEEILSQLSAKDVAFNTATVIEKLT